MDRECLANCNDIEYLTYVSVSGIYWLRIKLCIWNEAYPNAHMFMLCGQLVGLACREHNMVQLEFYGFLILNGEMFETPGFKIKCRQLEGKTKA